MPAEAGLIHREIAQGQDDEHEDYRQRDDARDVAGAKEGERRIRHADGRTLCNNVGKAAAHAHGGQGGYEGGDLEPRRYRPVYETDARSDDQGRYDGEDGALRRFEDLRADHADEGIHGTDRKVDVAQQDYHEHAHRRDARDGHLTQDAYSVAETEEALGQERKQYDLQQQKEKQRELPYDFNVSSLFHFHAQHLSSAQRTEFFPGPAPRWGCPELWPRRA